jgi:hypothetical protein
LILLLFVCFLCLVQVIQLVHSIRQEVRRDDRSKASTMIWQANKSHYIHKYLHKNVIMHVSSADPGHVSRCVSDVFL